MASFSVGLSAELADELYRRWNLWVHGAGKPKYFAHLCVRKDSGNLTDNGQVFDLQLAAVILSRL